MTESSAETSRPNWLRSCNHFLSLLAAGLALYILLMPFWPLLSLYLKKMSSAQPPLINISATHPANHTDIPAANTLVIPKLYLSARINEGQTLAALRNGVWHRPGTGSPDSGGNTVIAGHRFTYSGQAVFYNLDKLAVGDRAVVFWRGREYDYQISEIKTVGPLASEIEAPTQQPVLTLYTCTPLWSAKNRLIIVANPVKNS